MATAPTVSSTTRYSRPIPLSRVPSPKAVRDRKLSVCDIPKRLLSCEEGRSGSPVWTPDARSASPGNLTS